ncbi:MAG: glycosyltransferase [Candidatus Peribacteraceae bacterium]
MKIALTADWLPVFAGAEHVIAEFHALWPQAPLYTAIANHGHLGPLDRADIHTSTLQQWYRLLGKHHRPLLPLMPRALERFDLSEYDVILSSSHAVGKGIIPPSSARHICYCHTPMRYAWEMEEEYLRDSRIPHFLWKRIRTYLRQLRRWDMTSAMRVDTFIANSRSVAERIQRIYNRESVVIHPPVADRFFSASLEQKKSDAPFLAVGRMVPYKRFDLLIECANAHQIALTIAGTGPEEERLRRMAGPTVKFLGFVPDEELCPLYAGARAVLFPPEEDAGIVPLEAQACGTPVIALGKGGALETVIEGGTGVFFEEQTVASLKDAIDRFATVSFDSRTIRDHAKQFSSEKFRKHILQVVD